MGSCVPGTKNLMKAPIFRLEEDIQAFQESEEASKAMADVPNDDTAFSSRRQSRVRTASSVTR